MRFSSSTAAIAVLSQIAWAAPAPNAELNPGSSCLEPAVRREWRTLSSADKADFIRASNCVAKLPHDPKLTRTFPVSDIDPEIQTNASLYDDFVFLHIDLNTKFHYTALFFPWHRWFIHTYERIMTEQCGYQGTIPYWDWRLDTADVEHSPIFEDDPVSGIGRWGDVNNDYQINTGGFADFRLRYPSLHGVRRQFKIQPYAKKNESLLFPEPLRLANTTLTFDKVNTALTDCTGDYHCFQTHVEGMQNIHGGGHSIVGGDLGGICPANAPSTCINGPEFTANDPGTFWFHHSQLDRIWYTWQHASKQNEQAFSGGTIQNLTQYGTFPTGLAPAATFDTKLPANGLFGPEWNVGDVMSTTNGNLCYVYDQLA